MHTLISYFLVTDVAPLPKPKSAVLHPSEASTNTARGKEFIFDHNVLLNHIMSRTMLPSIKTANNGRSPKARCSDRKSVSDAVSNGIS